METSPYSPPQTELLGDQEAYGTIKIFSPKGRIGRLRYIGYSFGITFGFYLVLALIVGLVSAVSSPETVGMVITPIAILGYLVLAYIAIVLTIQRCHDFNVTGWLTLIIFIPLAPLLFWFLPGTEGANRFGLQPPPNKGTGVIIAIILVMFVVMAILAAIAIPAYQAYVAEAQAAAAGM
jgi:uncharacterized membrane protein YhaH (DUF805 family)